MSQPDTLRHHSSGRYHSLGQIALLVLGLGLIAVSVLFFILSIAKPYMGVELTKTGKQWVVGIVDDYGAANQAGIIEGDGLVEINGQNADEFLQKYEAAGVVVGALINELKAVDARGQITIVRLDGLSPSRHSVAETAALLVASLVFWLVGLFVVLRKPGNIEAWLLYVSGLALGLALSANGASVRHISFATEIAAISTIFFPWVLLNFLLVLPEERVTLRRSRLTYLIYLLPAITVALFFTVGYADGQPVQWFRTVRLFEYGLGFVAVVGAVIFNYAKATSIKTKQQMRIVLASCVVALVPALIFNVLPAGIWGQPIVPGTVSALFIAFIPLGMGYAVVTQKLMDIDLIIRRGVIYGLLTLMMTIILSAAIFPVLAFRKAIGVPETILITLVLGGIATVLFGPVKKGTETLVDKVLYKDRYDYRQIIQGMSTSLNLLNDFTDISRLVVGTAVQTLNLAGGCLMIRAQSGDYSVSAAQGAFTDAVVQARLLDLLSNRYGSVEFPNLATKINSDAAYIIPLVATQKEVGVLCLSQKTTRQEFSSDDLFLLQGLASLSATALHRATLVRDVSLRDTFVSIASHELRTPLTPILGYADLMLQRDPSEETRRRWLQIILDNSQKINDIVDDLLNVTRIQSGKVTLKLDRTNLSDIINEELSLVNESSAKHEIIADIQPNLPDVRADRAKLGQVVGNLLNNAIKYSPAGGKVTLSARADPSRHRVIVSVTDQGIGISPEDKGSLFTTFQRIQRPETQGIRGSGLGLYIAKEWTQAMSGEIWFESELNKGSIFFVGIPMFDSE